MSLILFFLGMPLIVFLLARIFQNGMPKVVFMALELVFAFLVDRANRGYVRKAGTWKAILSRYQDENRSRRFLGRVIAVVAFFGSIIVGISLTFLFV